MARLGAALAALINKEKISSLGLVLPADCQWACAAQAPGDRKRTREASGGSPRAKAKEAPGQEHAGRVSNRQLQAIVESLLAELVPNKRFKGSFASKGSEEKSFKFSSLSLFLPNPSAFTESLKVARVMSTANNLAAQLVGAPANFCTPVTLAHEAQAIAKECSLQCKVLGLGEIEALGMGAYLGVAKGSLFPPRFIHLTYTPPAASGKKASEMEKLAFIGKGITFDSGGYNLKVGASEIEMMKSDMAGAAAVLGAARAIGELAPPHVVCHFIVAAAENMVDRTAYRPGDIIQASNGKTIEVGNTDAEGRLTLADALVYAEKLHVDAIVDVATLTGACVVALGNKVGGIWSSHELLSKQLENAGACAGESMWPMPMVAEYREMLDSKLADLNNVCLRGKGGAILAALFLKEFVKSTPWAHLDIAGKATDAKDGRANGFGVKLLTEFILTRSKLAGGAQE
eukprot:GHVT01016840.1.p1 GENE.GHVT01016840.1~~GHVT01016840.1.p1  ORF type:complete len:459 (+),score=139.24 GHVT01016840.1:865-2241(+)